MLLLKTKQDYITVIEIVKSVVHRIDPYSLLAGGSPDDEFDSEISSIVNQLQQCDSKNDVSHAIALVLTSSFGEKFKPSEFQFEGKLIYDALKNKGFL